MSEIVMYDICQICLFQIRWYQDWVGTKRFAERMWVERVHYKCWKKKEEDARTGASQMAVSGVGDEFTLRTPEPRT